MKPYTNYKPSNVQWIGDIPEHWIIKRLKYVKDEVPNSFVDGPFGSNLKTEHYIDNGEVYVIDSGYITSGEFVQHRDFKTISEEHFETIKRSECIEDDIIISKIGANFGMSGILPKLNKPSVVSGNSLKLSISKNFHLKFIHYQLLSLKMQGQLDILVKGSAQPALTLGLMNNLPIPSAPLPEQTAIANFLDHKTKLIDSAIAKKQQLVEMLEEERRALINEAVSKSNTNNQNWKAQRLKHLTTKIGSGVTPTGGSEVYQDSGIPLIRSQNVYFEGLKMDDVAYINEEIHNSMSNSKVLEGDVLLNITGASLGRCFYIENISGEANVNQHVCIVRPNKSILTKYLYLLFRSETGQLQIELGQNGSAREGLNFENLKNFKFLIPPIQEQRRIISSIEAENRRIDNTISKINREIELLTEYRQSLIFEAVTGKIKV